MAYLGRSLSNGNYLKLDDISSQFNGIDTTFNLTTGGEAFYPGSTYSILVILSGVVQEADTAYQVLNNQIIFAAAPTSSDTFYCLVLGIALGTGVPATGSITGDKFAKPFSYDNGLLYLDDTNNYVGINTTSPSIALDVVGDASISGVITATSFSGTFSGESTTAGYATTAGIATVAQGLTGTPNIAVGVITASSLEISGNVSIAGTLTYEDVTNIDSIGVITARSDVLVGGNLNVTGVSTFNNVTGTAVTATTANITNLTGTLSGVSTNFVSAVGIQSAGTVIGAGITQLNFIGTGNTFAVNGTTVDISISGGGGGGSVSGIATGSGTDGVTLVGIGTTVVTGAGNSEGALQVYGNVAIVEGALLTDINLDSDIYVPSGKNGLLIGPVTVGAGFTVDVASGSVLVVV